MIHPLGYKLINRRTHKQESSEKVEFISLLVKKNTKIYAGVV